MTLSVDNPSRLIEAFAKAMAAVSDRPPDDRFAFACVLVTMAMVPSDASHDVRMATASRLPVVLSDYFMKQAGLAAANLLKDETAYADFRRRLDAYFELYSILV